MRFVLNALSIIRDFTFTVDCPREYLSSHIDVAPDKRDMFESYKTGSTFKGFVSEKKFEVRRKDQLFGLQPFLRVKLKGTLADVTVNRTTIVAEANALNFRVILFLVFFLLLFYSFILSMTQGDAPILSMREIILWSALYVFLLIVFPFLVIRWMVSTSINVLEKQCIAIARKYKSNP